MQNDKNSHYHIFLLRHGESIGNAGGYHQGQSDFPLTQNGMAQSRALAQHWRKRQLPVDRIISSPLARARQTAEILAESLDIPIEYDPVWMERNIGELSGLHPDEAATRYPRPIFMHPYMPVGIHGESQWDLYLRAGRAVQGLMRQPPGSYVVVSHGGILNLVLYAILGITPQANFHGPRFRFRNTAYATLTYSPFEHKWSLLGLNERNHWQDAEDPLISLSGSAPSEREP